MSAQNRHEAVDCRTMAHSEHHKPPPRNASREMLNQRSGLRDNFLHAKVAYGR